MSKEVKKDVKRERIARGQCPNCGKEAAPYYLCYDCRFKNKIVRILNRAESVGSFKSEKRGRDKYWSLGPDPRAMDRLVWRPDPKAGDGRLAPRLRGIRVDVEATLINVIKYIGRPCTLDEILVAWGRLRERRDAPLSADLARIIAADDKRKRKARKRAELDARQRAVPDRIIP